MSKKIRFAIIGASGIAPGHIQALQNNPDVEVVYIYSRDFSRSEKFAGRFSLTPAKCYEEILDDKSIDAIDIVTEPSRHAKLALEAMKYEKHILIEKPLDTDLEIAEKVVIESKKSSIITSVVSQKRFDPIIENMKQKLDKGYIGKPYLVEIKLLWNRTNEYYDQGNGWRGKEGNVLINQAVHWIDIGLWFFNYPTRVKLIKQKVKENISCYDTAICCLEFPNKILFNIVCSTALHKSQPEEFRIYGTEGILDYQNSRNIKFRYLYPKLNKLFNFPKSGKAPFQRQIDDFVDSIINKKPPAVLVSDAYNALKVVKSCEESNE